MANDPRSLSDDDVDRGPPLAEARDARDAPPNQGDPIAERRGGSLSEDEMDARDPQSVSNTGQQQNGSYGDEQRDPAQAAQDNRATTDRDPYDQDDQAGQVADGAGVGVADDGERDHSEGRGPSLIPHFADNYSARDGQGQDDGYGQADQADSYAAGAQGGNSQSGSGEGWFSRHFHHNQQQQQQGSAAGYGDDPYDRSGSNDGYDRNDGYNDYDQQGQTGGDGESCPVSRAERSLILVLLP